MSKTEIKPVWNSSSFLTYLGGLTVLGGALAALVYLIQNYRGHGQETAWALLLYVILFGIAYALRRAEDSLASGIFAFDSVILWGALVILTFDWWGWNGVN